MVSAELLHKLEHMARVLRGTDRPFGGMRIIVFGDFFQLGPTKGDYAFQSQAWKDANFTHLELTQVLSPC